MNVYKLKKINTNTNAHNAHVAVVERAITDEYYFSLLLFALSPGTYA